jgi:hypothetical protein
MGQAEQEKPPLAPSLSYRNARRVLKQPLHCLAIC